MTRIAMGVEYDGSAYRGWQHQDGLNTVQDQVEKALSYVADQPVTVVCAGRTDAGVHAFGQVIHFETNAKRLNMAWVQGGNDQLPPDVRFLWAKPVVADFHARYKAVARSYRYMIYNHHVGSALLRKRAYWFRYQLDIEAMQAAAYYLLGEHDFSAFRAAGCQSHSPRRRVLDLKITSGGNLVYVDIKANAFLYHMVRNIVGSLLKIGAGRKPSEWMRELLNSRDRRQGGVTVPAWGLYLMNVEYPASLFLN